MPATPPARLVLLGSLSVFGLTGAALAGMTLAEAIKQEDAKYLDAPDVTVKDDAPKIEAGEGEEGTEPKPQEISQGAVRDRESTTHTFKYVDAVELQGSQPHLPTEVVYA